MKKILLSSLCAFFLSGCAAVLTGTPDSGAFRDAPLVLAYPAPEIIRDQTKVATLIVSIRYGVTIDGIPIKELEGDFNPELRVSRGLGNAVYLVDLLPGTHALLVTYDAMTGADGKPPTARAEQGVGGGSAVSGSYSGKLFTWNRTSETSHMLKGGDIFAIGLKMMSITGAIDLYDQDEAARGVVIETRNRAQF